MADDILNLSAAFPDPDEAQWQSLVEKALKGKGPEALNSKTYDGLLRKALYRESDWASATDPDGMPGLEPFIRGTTPVKDKFLPWDIRQSFAHPDPKVSNHEIMKDLENGVSSVELRIDPTGERGIVINTADDFSALLDGVYTDLASVALTSVTEDSFGLEAAALLIAWTKAQGKKPEAQKFHFNVDPLGDLARTGNLTDTLDAVMGQTAAFVLHASETFKFSKFLRADARPVHESGGSEAQELAALIASGVDYLRVLTFAGLSPADASDAILFTMATGPDYTLEIAKLKAARRLWARVMSAFGDDSMRPMVLQSVSSKRMLTRRDPWVNLLRNTAACFAAGVGGADIVTLRGFTDALGLPNSLARRLGRNTQIMAQEESSLGKVSDPTSGAWTIDKMADDLANTAWELFQEIEAQGGYGAALEKDFLQPKIADVRNARRKAIAKRKDAITGVSEFPLLTEVEPEFIERDLTNLSVNPGVSTPRDREKRTWFETLTGAERGTGLLELIPMMEAEESAIGSPLWPMRLAEPYERLRDHADAFMEKTGKRPGVFLANLGALSDHNARATFAANFFAAGGIEAIAAEGIFHEMGVLADAFAGSDKLLVCICGSDKQYASMAAEAAKALKAAKPDARVYLAGRPGDLEKTLREDGVDDFIFVGSDVIATLELAHAELGVSLNV